MKYYLLAILVALPSITAAQERTFNSIPFLDGVVNTANVADALFNVAIAIAAILVVIRLIWAGTEYMLSDLVTSKEAAKKKIQDALIGLLIILGAVTILQTINPQLLNLNALGELDSTELEGLTTGPSGAYVTGDFPIGDTMSASYINNFCNNQASRDELCANRIRISLAEKCSESGGTLRSQFIGRGDVYSCE